MIHIKSFSSPDETREFSRGFVEVVRVDDQEIGHFVLKPGWHWLTDVQPLVRTDWCEQPHTQFVISGVLHIIMSSGEEFDLRPGDVAAVPPGHDAWVVGDEAVVAIDWGAHGYAADAEGVHAAEGGI